MACQDVLPRQTRLPSCATVKRHIHISLWSVLFMTERRRFLGGALEETLTVSTIRQKQHLFALVRSCRCELYLFADVDVHGCGCGCVCGCMVVDVDVFVDVGVVWHGRGCGHLIRICLW